MSRIALFAGLPLLVVAVWAADTTPARPKWTTSKVVGQPDPPPPYRPVNAFQNLTFNHPLVMAAEPGTDRLYVGEQDGKIFSFPNRPDAKKTLFADLKRDLKQLAPHPGSSGFEFVYGLAFHPDYAKNRTVFVCYTLRGKKGQTGPYQHDKNLPDGSRVSRFRVTDADPPTLDVKTEQVLFTFVQGGHNGGDLHFGPDGYLYITTGDATDPNPPDLFRTGQDVSDLESSILRIDVNRADPGKHYAIPKDNPFVSQTVNGKPARGEVWAYGFRNPWRMSFDRATGDLWTGDVGWERWEMVHKVEKGGNYGWSVVEGRQAVNTTWPVGPTPVRPPVVEIDHAAGASVTGGYVYRGKKLPGLVGKYIFGDWSSRRFWAAKADGDRLVSLEELTDPYVRVVAFGEDHAGELYFLDYDAGTVHTFEPNDAAKHDPKAFPRTLSATGLFASVKEQTPADGVLRYEVASAMWADGATAERFVALPGDSKVIDNTTRKPIPGNVTWHNFQYHFPKNAVLAKTFAGAGGNRIETQILHFDGENWRGYTYQWRDDGTDADLVPADGSEKTVTLPDPHRPGKTREQMWTFSSRQQCIQCHHFWAEYAIGFHAVQLNVGDQLVRLTESGVIARKDGNGKPQPAFTRETAAKQKKLVSPSDTTASVEDRTRAYFHANCGHCHMFGGGGAVDFELHGHADLKSNKLIDAAPTRGTFELTDPKVIAAGDPCRSVLFYRMAKFGGGRMPHLGSEMVDPLGVRLAREWIRSLKPGAERTAKSLGSPSDALAVCTDADERDAVLGEVAKLPSGNVRDLFEGYLPNDGKPRKLGANPRPRSILSLTSDPANGKALFFSTRSQCATCHQLQGQGIALGPDLVAVTKTRTREDLLESILEPSRRIDPAFQTVQMRTLDGRSLSGLLVKKDDKEVVLRDAQNKTTTVPVADIEAFTVSRQSLMPDGLLRDFTPQEAADVLAYLHSLKQP